MLLEQAAQPINIDRWHKHLKLVSICISARVHIHGILVLVLITNKTKQHTLTLGAAKPADASGTVVDMTAGASVSSTRLS